MQTTVVLLHHLGALDAGRQMLDICQRGARGKNWRGTTKVEQAHMGHPRPYFRSTFEGRRVS